MTSSPDPKPTRSRRGGGLPLVLLMAGSLVGASLLRGVVVRKYGPERDVAGNAAGTAPVAQFNSYTLGLLLGGLRGPLVMSLWSTSETQKGDRNLEDINTKIELIGLLQPEFDAVHLFQIWNKAYNLSVQMANLPSKYATILDALDYADKRRAYHRDGNINIEAQVASIYFDKLGGSTEKAYYRQHVREESRQPLGQTQFVFPEARRDEFVAAALAAGADARRYSIRPESGSDGKLSVRLGNEYAKALLPRFTGPDVKATDVPPRDPSRASRASMRTALTPVLDADGRLLDGVYNRSASSQYKADQYKADDVTWRPQDGELAYLAPFEPFPYGVSPYALGYDYYKRAVALQEDRKQKHAQLSDRVISSRPALALKGWAEEELELGRRAEMAQFGLAAQSEERSPLPLEMPATVLRADRTPLTPLLAEAIYSYRRAAELGQKSLAEFAAHVGRYRDDARDYHSQTADIIAKTALAEGDGLFLEAITAADDAARAAHARQAAQAYRRAIDLMHRNVIAFFIDDDTIAKTFPKGYGKLDVINSFDDPAAFPAALVEPTMGASLKAMSQGGMAVGSEVNEYLTYAGRAEARLATLAPLLGTSQ